MYAYYMYDDPPPKKKGGRGMHATPSENIVAQGLCNTPPKLAHHRWVPATVSKFYWCAWLAAILKNM